MSRRELVKFIVLTSAALVVGQFWIVLKSAFSRPAAPSAGRADRPRGRVVDRRRQDVHLPRRQHAAAARADRRGHLRRLRPAVHAPAVPGGSRCRQSGAFTAPATTAGSTCETGRPVAGPPQRALPRILVEVRDGTVYATGVEESTT